MIDSQSLIEAVVVGNKEEVERAVRAALAAGVPPERILNEALIPAMGKVGQQFEAGECFVPEMLVAARAMKAGVEILRPVLLSTDIQPKYTIVLGTVKGDLHDIGKNLVGLMLEGAGFRVIDLGVNVPAETFVQAARGEVHLVGLSALITTTMPNMAGVIQALKEAGLREKVKVLVGGAPITQEVADFLGADGYASDAGAAARKAVELMGAP